jgi:hypothetical protein
MTELDDYKRQMAPTATPEPMCTRLCSYLLEARRERDVLRAQLAAYPQTEQAVYAIRVGGGTDEL